MVLDFSPTTMTEEVMPVVPSVYTVSAYGDRFSDSDRDQDQRQ